VSRALKGLTSGKRSVLSEAGRQGQSPLLSSSSRDRYGLSPTASHHRTGRLPLSCTSSTFCAAGSALHDGQRVEFAAEQDVVQVSRASRFELLEVQVTREDAFVISTSAIFKHECRMVSAVGRSVRLGCLRIDRVLLHDVTRCWHRISDAHRTATTTTPPTPTQSAPMIRQPFAATTNGSPPGARETILVAAAAAAGSGGSEHRRGGIRVPSPPRWVRSPAHRPPSATQGAVGRDQDSTSRIRAESLPSRRRQTATVAGSRCTVRPTKAPLGGHSSRCSSYNERPQAGADDE
jgi:hypothetical protein